jgi:membrane-associated phospholipid phosphatase
VLLVASASSAHADTNPKGRTTSGDVGDALEFVIPAVTLAATIINKDRRGTREFSAGLAATLGATYVLKESISKERPDGRDDDSFPSSHTAVSFHAAAFVQRRYGWKWATPMYLTAMWVGYSRVHDDRHDEQDVLAGAALGYVAAHYFTTQYNGVQITPALTDNFVGVQLSYRF